MIEVWVNGGIAAVVGLVTLMLTRMFRQGDIAQDEHNRLVEEFAAERWMHRAVADRMLAELDGRAVALAAPRPAPAPVVSPELHLWTAVLLPEDRDWFRAHAWHGPIA